MTGVHPNEAEIVPEGQVDVLAPRDEQGVVELVTWARAAGVRLRPAGAGRFLDKAAPSASSSPPEAPASVRRLSSQALNQVLEHTPDDLTVRVQAGVPLRVLAETLAQAGQWFPVDPPGAPDVTVGGMVAMGLTGPLAAGYGRVRDHLLGATLVTGRGEVLALGGRVVKNVAGFDLLRLVVGSRGRLGMLTDVTLRLFPTPAVDKTLLWRFSGFEAGIPAGRAAAQLGLPLAALEWYGPLGAGEGVVAARVQGRFETVQALNHRLVASLGTPDVQLEDEASVGWWMARAQDEAPVGGEARPSGFRVPALPAEGEAVVRRLVRAWEEDVVEESEDAGMLAVHLLEGGVRVRPPTGRRGVAPVNEMEPVTAIESVTAAAPHVDPVRDRLVQGVFQVFDPHGVFAPPSARSEGAS